MKKRSTKRTVKPKVTNSTMPAEVQKEHNHMLKNGLGDAIMSFSESILGFNPGSIGVQLSQVDTLFKNQRWYLVSNMRQLLSEMYVESGLVQTIVDVPVDDGLRGGIEIMTKQLDEEQIRQLKISLDRNDEITTTGKALKWNRLFGGAGVLIMTDQDPESPLDVDALTEDSPLEFRAVDMWELFWDKQNTEGYNPEIQEHEFEFYNYYAKKIHKSRVMKLKGITAPSFIRPRLRGWGFSVVESLVRSINQYLKATDLTFEVLDEFKIDVYKVKNLTNTLLSSQGTEQVSKRIQLANFQKNYQHAITMDSEDDYIQKELSFAGLAETMAGIRMQVASDMRMPLTKLFGISAAGFSSGEDDIENYNAMVESQVRQKSKYHILKMIELKCQKMFGFIPDDLEITFKPLRILNAEQEENVKTQKFNRVLAAQTAGAINAIQFAEMCNKDNLLPTQIDTSMISLEMEDEAEAGAEGGEPGADKEESRKPQLSAKAPASTLKPKEAPLAKNDDGEDELLNEWDNLSLASQASYTIRNPGKVDEALWEKAKSASKKAFGREKWAFISWWYQKHGGKFHGQ